MKKLISKPKEDGFYWLDFEGSLPKIGEVKSGQVYYDGIGKKIEDVNCNFVGPIPDIYNCSRDEIEFNCEIIGEESAGINYSNFIVKINIDEGVLEEDETQGFSSYVQEMLEEWFSDAVVTKISVN